MSSDASKGEVTLNHEAIPGFMEAMTMPYKLKDPSILSELHPGDVITADVLVSQSEDADVLLDHIVVVAQGKPDYRPAVFYHVPARAMPFPISRLRNQDGRAIHLGQFRGQGSADHIHLHALPPAQFLPAGHAQLCSDSRSNWLRTHRLHGKTHLLCVSFDPEHDTPERLRAYGATYIGSDAKSAFADWDFAVPEKPALLEMAKFFDVGITNEPDETITHTFRRH